MTDETENTPTILGSNTQLKVVLDASPIGVSISRYHDGKIVYVNHALAEKLWGGPAEKLMGTNSIDHYNDAKDIQWVISQLQQHRPVTNHEMEMKRRDGTTLWCQVNMVAMRVDGTKLILSWFNNITEIRQTRTKLQQMATHDCLTGLPNRMRFNEFMEESMARCRRQKKTGSLLFLDLDGFKEVNDNFGHHMGDILLQQVASRLTSTLRETDFISRLGGDEFAVVLELQSDAHGQCEDVAQKILDVIKRPYEYENNRAIIGVSIGIAFFGTEPVTMDVITRNADKAMYRAKYSGRGCVCLYDPDLDSAD
jgi:diguanylate cyclase (GGDEF)-like protein/PAS domain S-box-containing protein